jgi:hypothetical protein
MIGVSVEICGRADRIRAAVWSESIERALSLARAHNPNCKVSIVFPIEPEGFFVTGARPLFETIVPEALEQVIGSASVDQSRSESSGPHIVAG